MWPKNWVFSRLSCDMLIHELQTLSPVSMWDNSKVHRGWTHDKEMAHSQESHPKSKFLVTAEIYLSATFSLNISYFFGFLHWMFVFQDKVNPKIIKLLPCSILEHNFQLNTIFNWTQIIFQYLSNFLWKRRRDELKMLNQKGFYPIVQAK